MGTRKALRARTAAEATQSAASPAPLRGGLQQWFLIM